MYKASGKRYLAARLSAYANLDLVEASQGVVEVTTASRTLRLPVSYARFRDIFNKTAEGSIISVSALTAAPELIPGAKMPDGTIYAGLSPDIGKAMYTTSADAPLTMQWKAAMKYAADLDAHGHQDWRAPTKGELNVLFQNKAAIGGFDVTGSYPAGWYWSATEYDVNYAWAQRFSDGLQNWGGKDNDSSLRCVR